MFRHPRVQLAVLALAACVALLAVPAASAISSGTIVFRAHRGTASFIYTMNADGGDLKQWGPGVQPTISRNGKTIVYAKASEEGQLDLWARNADGRDLRQLTHDPSSTSPSLAPNGQKVVFIRARPDGDGANIFTIDIDGTNERKVTQGAGNYYSPSFSADGKRIVFLAQIDGKREIETMDSGGGDVVELAAASTGLREVEKPSYSPDGKQILFSASSGKAARIFLCDAKDGGGRVSLTKPDEEGAEPAFSPPGTAIVFRRGANLFRMNTDGSAVRQLTDVGASSANADPSWGE